jgi:PAS domain S-box-containing protein
MSLQAESSTETGTKPDDAAIGDTTLFACFVDGIADLAYMKSLDGRYLLVNEANARFLGKPKSEIIGLDDYAVFPPEQARLIVDQDRAVFLCGGSLTFEDEMERPGGTVFLQTVKSVCRDSAGQMVGLVGISRDISERKLLEHTLRTREAELREARRIAKLGTWTYDCASGATTWSEEIYRIYGVDPNEPAQKYSECIDGGVHPTNRRFLDAFDRAIRFGEPYSIDLELRRPDGGVRWIAASGEVDRWQDGKVMSLRGTVQDITERKLAEREIALRENRYRSLAHATSQIVWVGNADGNQMGSVPEWRAFTGQSDQDVLGFGWAAAIHPDDRQRTVEHWKACIQSGNIFVLEQRLRRFDGVYRDMMVRAVPVRDESGKIVEWVGTHTDVSDQKQAERESRIAHERLQNVLDSITDGLCVLDHDWRYTYFNESGARMVNRRPEEIIGTRLGDIYSENKLNAFGRAYLGAVESGEAKHLEEFYGPPLNKWFEGNCYPSKHGLTVYFRDITERKRIEEALRTSESRFRQLFRSELMGICIPDRFGAFKEGNDELLRITGYSRAELEAGLVRWDTMTPPEYAALDAAHIDQAARHGSCTPYEKEYIRKDGTRVPILCGYALLEGSQDEYIGFVLDLTRQRQAESELRDREQRFRLLAEGLPELVWITDTVGSLIYLNDRFLKYCGIAEAEMIGFDWQTILHPEEVERVNNAWNRSVRTGEPYLIELRLRCHDGSFRYFLARALPLLNAEGGVERWVGSCADIHDQRLAEEALRRSEKLAATGRLAASIAHEINNPLSSVINTLYLALHDPSLTPEIRKLLQTADEELARVSHITTQTLRFHRQSKAASVANLTEVMQSVVNLFRPRFAARQIEIVSECDPETAVWCFEDELRQVFANLVSNSLDATPDEGRLRVRVRNRSSNGVPGVRVTVGDTGCGIRPEIQHRIFEPFFSTKDETGIGLGLWVSDGILRKHGGCVSIRSSTAPGRSGTVFSLFFPHDGLRQQ